MGKVKVYIATHCQPCQPIKELLEKGHFLVNGKEDKADLIDIESEEGFKEIIPELDGVPAAYQDGKRCQIRIEDDTLLLECGENESSH